MSDCFDHEQDAFDSQLNDSVYGDGGGYSGYTARSNFSRNPLFYHRIHVNTAVEKETDKAYLIRFDNGDRCWIAKKLCKKVKKRSLYIWYKAILTPIKEEIDK